ncbi:MAG: lysozyme inhibitor LprI family protein [Rhizomicrobium sp.]
MMRCAILALAILGAAPALAADGPPKSAAFEACAAKAHGVTFSLLHCYAREMQAADDAMAAAYDGASKAASDPRTRDYLTRSQTAWGSYRDAWCEASVPRSGSLARFKLFECRLAETARRTAALKAAAE